MPPKKKLNVKKQRLFTKRENSKRYADTDHRVDVTVCNHSRYLDKVFPFTATCLDCGSEIGVGNCIFHPGKQWDTHPIVAQIDDDVLSDVRVQYNNFCDGTSAEPPSIPTTTVAPTPVVSPSDFPIIT